MKVLVTGSRRYRDCNTVRRVLIDCGATVVVHGDCKGADQLAKRAALSLGLEHRPYPADWKRYGKSAGPKRNQRMLDEEHLPDDPIELTLAFPLPDSKGTWDMCERADKAGIEVRVYGDTGIRRRDTPDHRAYWKFVSDTAEHVQQTLPDWALRRGDGEAT